MFHIPTLPNVSSTEDLSRREHQAFALFIDEGLEGYHIVDAEGASFPNFSESDGSNPDISTLPSEK
jgi:hypothetical protein